MERGFYLGWSATFCHGMFSRRSVRSITLVSEQRRLVFQDTNRFLSEHHHQRILHGVNPVIQAIVFTMVALQIVSKGRPFWMSLCPGNDGDVVRLALLGTQNAISPQTAKLLGDLPVDPEAAARQFKLDGKSMIYATCPNPDCHKTYKPIYLERLSYRRVSKVLQLQTICKRIVLWNRTNQTSSHR